MEKTTVIELSSPIEDKSLKQEWTELTLKEPTLLQAEQYYAKEKETGNPLTSTRFLIHLVSGVSESALKSMSLRDFKKCDVWLKAFFIG